MEQNSRITLVLASSSPRRRELIRMLGLPVEAVPSGADETIEPHWTPQQIVENLALRKAQGAKFAHTGPGRRIMIGSDTIVVLNGKVLGKPRDAEEAAGMLRELQGRTHSVYTGLALIEGSDKGPDGAGAKGESPGILVGSAVSRVTFRPMSEEEIRGYIRTGEPMDKAGAYGVQGIGAVFIEKIEGDFFSVMGLPLNLLYRMLLQFGVSPFCEE